MQEHKWQKHKCIQCPNEATENGLLCDACRKKIRDELPELVARIREECKKLREAQE